MGTLAPVAGIYREAEADNICVAGAADAAPGVPATGGGVEPEGDTAVEGS